MKNMIFQPTERRFDIQICPFETKLEAEDSRVTVLARHPQQPAKQDRSRCISRWLRIARVLLNCLTSCVRIC